MLPFGINELPHFQAEDPLQGYGLVRLLRDVWAVPGVIRWRRGWMVSVRFSPLHPLATPLQASFSALFHGRVRVGFLR